jgi:hypothetical protein
MDYRAALATALADAIEAIRRNPYKILQESRHDWEDGLNATEIIGLAEKADAGPIITINPEDSDNCTNATMLFHREGRKTLKLSMLGGSGYRPYPWSDEAGKQILEALEAWLEMAKRPDGVFPPIVRLRGIDYAPELQPMQWDLLKCLFGRLSVPTTEVGKTVWKDSRTDYNGVIKHQVLNLNHALSAVAMPLSYGKPRGRDAIEQT